MLPQKFFAQKGELSGRAFIGKGVFLFRAYIHYFC